MMLYVIFCLTGISVYSDEIQERETVTLGTILFPPGTNIEKESGRCIGNNIDKTRQILLHLNIDINIVCTSPIRIYRMIENNELDFTINIKSTSALAPHVEFTNKPFRKIILNIYRYKEIPVIGSIAAVRGFDYNGFRQVYLNKDVEFLDLPNTISAIQMFARKRSDALLSYQTPMEYYLALKNIELGDSVVVETLLTLDTFYAINKNSPYFEMLKSSLDDFAQKEKLNYFIEFGIEK